MTEAPTALKDWSDIALKWISSLGIVAAGAWAYFNWSSADTNAANVELRLTADTSPYGAGCNLLAVHVRPKNIGKVLVQPGKQGIRVSVAEVPRGLPVGAVAAKQLVPLAEEKDLTKRFKDGYEMEPGVEYDELVLFVVPAGMTLVAQAEMDLGPEGGVDTEVDAALVVPASNAGPTDCRSQGPQGIQDTPAARP
jgi:hypothetical protein